MWSIICSKYNSKSVPKAATKFSCCITCAIRLNEKTEKASLSFFAACSYCCWGSSSTKMRRMRTSKMFNAFLRKSKTIKIVLSHAKLCFHASYLHLSGLFGLRDECRQPESYSDPRDCQVKLTNLSPWQELQPTCALLNNRDHRDQHHTVRWPPCLPHRIPRPWTVHDQISLIRTACCEIIEHWKTRGSQSHTCLARISYYIKNSIRIDYLTILQNGPDEGWPFLLAHWGPIDFDHLREGIPIHGGILSMVAIGAQNQDAWPWRELDDKTRHAASHHSQNTVTVDELGQSSHYCMFDVLILKYWYYIYIILSYITHYIITI